MRLIDLPVDRTLISSDRRQEIVVFKHDDAYYGLKARRGTFTAGQIVPVLMSRNGENICWPKSKRS